MDPKRNVAIQILRQTGMWRSNYCPPYILLMWKLGFETRPPHFSPFWSNVLSLGAPFALIWGLYMWVINWSDQGVSIQSAMSTSSISGLIFGVVMAINYEYGKRKYRLPSWDELGLDSK